MLFRRVRVAWEEELKALRLGKGKPIAEVSNQRPTSADQQSSNAEEENVSTELGSHQTAQSNTVLVGAAELNNDLRGRKRQRGVVVTLHRSNSSDSTPASIETKTLKKQKRTSIFAALSSAPEKSIAEVDRRMFTQNKLRNN